MGLIRSSRSAPDAVSVGKYMSVSSLRYSSRPPIPS